MTPLHIETPLLESPVLREKSGCEVWLKLESLQPTGSFKNRGLCHMVQKSAAEGAARFVAASGGNAGLAVAYAGRQLGLPVTVVVPKSSPQMIIDRLRRQEAEVIIHGDSFSDAAEVAIEQAQQQDAVFVPPYDHPWIWEGNSSIIDEVVASGFKPDAVLLSVGGGGLLCGVLQGMERHGWQGVPVLAAEAAGAPTLHAAIEAGHVVRLDQVDSVAHSLAAKEVAQAAFSWTERHRVISVVVSEKATVEAVVGFADDHRLLVEPACGAALALLYQRHHSLKEFSKLLVIACGGAAVSWDLIADWKARFGL